MESGIAARGQDDLGAVLDIGRAVATGAPLPSTLSSIASRAAELVAAELAAILLLDGRGRLRYAAGHGLSAAYGENFRIHDPRLPVAAALRRRRPVVVADTETEPAFEPWRAVARREGYRAMVAQPLALDAVPIGVLTVYRRAAGPWSGTALGCLELIGAHVASAVRAAELIDDQKHRLTTLARVVEGLRQQREEHVAQLRTVGGLLEDSDTDGLHRAVARLETEHHETYAAVSERVASRILVALLLAETSIARRRGVRLRLDRRSRLDRLPARVTEPDALSVVSNLLDNALDAVAGQPASRRRVSLLLRREERRTVVRVRDWGTGPPARPHAALLRPGYTTKPGHSGTGLALVAQIATAAGGSLRIERLRVGGAFTVVVPNG